MRVVLGVGWRHVAKVIRELKRIILINILPLPSAWSYLTNAIVFTTQMIYNHSLYLKLLLITEHFRIKIGMIRCVNLIWMQFYA